MRGIPAQSYRLIALSLIAASAVTLFGFAAPAHAMPPPASTLRAILDQLLNQPPATCEVEVSLSVPNGRYTIEKKPWQLSIPLTVKMKRISGDGGKIQVTIPQLNELEQGTISSNTPSVTVQTGQPNLTIRTNNSVLNNETVTAVIDYPIQETAQPGTITFVATNVDSLDNNNQPVTCTDNVGQAGTGIEAPVVLEPAVQFDFEIDLTGPVQALPDQQVRIQSTIKNADSAKDAVPGATNFTVTFTYPNGDMKVVTSEPLANDDPTQGKLVWDKLVTESGGLAIGATHKVKPTADFLTDKRYVPNYPIQACIEPVSQWAKDHEVSENNCQTINIVGSKIRLIQTWSDGKADIRALAADQVAQTRLTLRNISPESVSNINLKDYLITSIFCNPLTMTDCPTWDDTVSWQNIPTGVAEQQPDNELVWNQPITIGGGQEQKIDLSFKVADAATLIAALQENADPHCSLGQATITNTPVNQQAILCWSYQLPSDLELTKQFKTSNGLTNAISIREGEIGTYAIGVRNNGSNAAYGVDFLDQQEEAASLGNSEHLVSWVKESISSDPAIMIDDKNHRLVGWSHANIPPGETRTLEPQFAVRCDALDLLRQRNQSRFNTITNVAEVTAANDANVSNNKNQPITATIVDGHYNLGLTASSNPTELVPSDSTKQETTLTVTVSNLDSDRSVNTAIPGLTIQLRIPAQFSLVDGSLNPAGTVDNGLVSWKIASLAPEASQNLSLKLRVNAAATEVNPPDMVLIDATSISAGATCGKAHFELPLPVKGPSFTVVKSVVEPADANVSLGETVTYELRITNTSTVADLKRSPGQELIVDDPLDQDLAYTGDADTSCQLATPPNNTQTVGCTADQQPSPSGSNQLRWVVSGIPKNTALIYRFKAKVNENAKLEVCPKPVYNSGVTNPSTLQDRLFPEKLPLIFNPAQISVYANRCLQGNIHARNLDSAEPNAIKVLSSDIIISPNSVLSSSGTIDCGSNQTCKDAPWKVGQYATGQSYGLNFAKVVRRMFVNRQRLTGSAQPINRARITPGIFDLLGGNDTSGLSRYPEGKVWLADDLTIDTGLPGQSVQFKGKGTIIVTGNLTVTGQGKITYDADSSAKTAVGFIILPKADGTGGNMTVEGDVRQVVGAYYAPGTLTDIPNTTTPITSGIMRFNPGTNPLRPAKGLFIARQFDLQREKIVLEYNSLLASPEGAPPGFTFTTAPTETQEGS